MIRYEKSSLITNSKDLQRRKKMMMEMMMMMTMMRMRMMKRKKRRKKVGLSSNFHFQIDFFPEKGGKSKKEYDGPERIDLPLGDDIDSALSRRRGGDSEPSSSKSHKSKNRGKSSGKSRKH